ncbi:MAG: hypothetical protein AAFP77_13905 [Bacteroidota bacterium]
MTNSNVTLTVLSVLILLRCSPVDQQKHAEELLSCNYSVEFDSNHNARSEKRLLELFVDESHLGKPNVEKWNSGIQIIGQGGWGEFEYYCSLYNDHDVNIEHLDVRENEVLACKILVNDTTLFDKNLSITVYLDGKKYYPVRERMYE